MSVDDLARKVKDPSTPVSEVRRVLPILAGSHLPRETQTALVNELLENASRGVRVMAAVMAGAMGDRSTISILEEMLAAGQRVGVLCSLVKLSGARSKPMVALLLKHADPVVRVEAANAAKRLPEYEGIPLLAQSFAEERVPHVRMSLATCLANKGRADGAHLLTPHLEDERSPHHIGAVCCLCGVGNRAALQRLLTLLGEYLALPDDAPFGLYWALSEGLALGHGTREEVFARAQRWVQSRLTEDER